MKSLNKVATGIAISLTLGAAAIAYAHPGAMGGNMGPGMQSGAHAPQAVQQLMTSEERTANMEKMRAAKTPEERQQIATGIRTEMQKRATEKGITLPEQRGPRFGATTLTPPAASGQTY